MHALLAGLESRFWAGRGGAAEPMLLGSEVYGAACRLLHHLLQQTPFAVAVLPHVCLGEHAGEGLVACMYRRSASATARSVCRDFCLFTPTYLHAKGCVSKHAVLRDNSVMGGGAALQCALLCGRSRKTLALTCHQLFQPTPFSYGLPCQLMWCAHVFRARLATLFWVLLPS